MLPLAETRGFEAAHLEANRLPLSRGRDAGHVVVKLGQGPATAITRHLLASVIVDSMEFPRGKVLPHDWLAGDRNDVCFESARPRGGWLRGW